MKLLADAHISAEMVAMLRDLGDDRLDSSAIPPRMPDVDVLRMAAADARAGLQPASVFHPLQRVVQSHTSKLGFCIHSARSEPILRVANPSSGRTGAQIRRGETGAR